MISESPISLTAGPHILIKIPLITPSFYLILVVLLRSSVSNRRPCTDSDGNFSLGSSVSDGRLSCFSTVSFFYFYSKHSFSAFFKALFLENYSPDLYQIFRT